MTRYMTPEQVATLDARVLTATVNDAIRAIAFGYATYEQAEFLSAWEADVAIDRLAEDEMGIFTEEDAREDATCHHGLSESLCMDPLGEFHFGTREWERSYYGD
jgi:hypothetical protein